MYVQLLDEYVPIAACQFQICIFSLLVAVEETAILYAMKNVSKPMCLLWLHHLCCNNVDACQRLRENHQLPDAILCKLGASLFMARKDAARLKALSGALDKSKIPKNALAKLYENLLEALLHHNRYDQIGMALENALEFVSVSDIKQQTLDKIRFGGKDLADAHNVLMKKSNK